MDTLRDMDCRTCVSERDECIGVAGEDNLDREQGRGQRRGGDGKGQEKGRRLRLGLGPGREKQKEGDTNKRQRQETREKLTAAADTIP